MTLLIKHKKITLLVLASFLALVFFGFTVAMNKELNGHMENNCPLSAFGALICPQDAFAAVFHHISGYQSFFGAPAYLKTVSFVVSLFFAASAIAILLTGPPLLKHRAFIGYAGNFSPFTSHSGKMMRRLSLFENSPSLL